MNEPFVVFLIAALQRRGVAPALLFWLERVHVARPSNTTLVTALWEAVPRADWLAELAACVNCKPDLIVRATRVAEVSANEAVEKSRENAMKKRHRDDGLFRARPLAAGADGFREVITASVFAAELDWMMRCEARVSVQQNGAGA